MPSPNSKAVSLITPVLFVVTAITNRCVLSQIPLMKYFRDIPPAVKDTMDKNI